MPDAIRAQFIRSAAVRYLWEFLGLPYRWGGDDAVLGFDCSGLIVEVLTAVGRIQPGEDLTANGIYLRWITRQVAKPYAGCLCLWFNPAGIATHVEMFVDEFHTVGASGGRETTTSSDVAAAQNAYVKMRPLGYRGTNFKVIDPFLEG